MTHTLWFAVASDGEMYCIGEADDFYDAHAQAVGMGLDFEVIVSPEQTEAWIDRLREWRGV